jgi:hypothetical protein
MSLFKKNTQILNKVKITKNPAISDRVKPKTN